jgi:diaminobutyrate-2-oxoglutarate transaminase
MNMDMASGLSTFDQHESNVRLYSRSFPAVFRKAKGSLLYAESGREYIDFFAGAGALNYGHNNDYIKDRLLAYIASDGITHGLDLSTTAKRGFIEAFVGGILAPRGLNYKLQFCAPTGTNAVEAALKLARKVTGRQGVISFMGAYHGMSLGALAATGSRSARASAGVGLDNVSFMPYADRHMSTDGSIEYLTRVLCDTHSGIDAPAAIIVEAIQADGGVIVAPDDWLRRLRRLCDDHKVLLICDEIQVGCFRSGPFFAFEHSGIVPDIVTLSKSISGYGLPMSLVLFKGELDVWQPGDHTGTFRGNQMAFVCGAAALELAEASGIESQVIRKGELIRSFLLERAGALDQRLIARGRGMIWGLDCSGVDLALARRVSARCFESGLVIETAGRSDAVLKLLPPLTMDDQTLHAGLAIIEQALRDCLDG